MSEAGAREKRAKATKAREERKLQLWEKRSRQLTEVRAAIKNLETDIRAHRSTMKMHEVLSSHSEGFYEEVNKLAKGKALLEVTNLAVAQANDIIRDAKNIINNDVYLDRVREFVPAGNNPVYPDVLVSIRSVRDSLTRGKKELENQLRAFQEPMRRAETVAASLEYFLDNANSETARKCPSKEAIEDLMSGLSSGFCFTQYSDVDDKYFDFDRLDRLTLQTYLSASNPDEGTGDGRGTESDGASEEDAELAEEEDSEE